MRRSKNEELADCDDCGAPVNVALERGYEGPGDRVLCNACARERGAQYDENEDCWTTPPDFAGLSAHREHRER